MYYESSQRLSDDIQMTLKVCNYVVVPRIRNTNDFIIIFLFLYIHYLQKHDNTYWRRPVNLSTSDRASDLFNISATSSASYTPSSVTVRRTARDRSLTM